MGNITFEIDKKNKVVFTTCTGKIELQDLIKHSNSVVLDKDFSPDLNSVSDISGAEISHSYELIDTFRKYLRRHDATRGNFMWAIVANEDADMNSVKLFKLLAIDAPFIIKIFNSKSKALAWITTSSPKA